MAEHTTLLWLGRWTAGAAVLLAGVGLWTFFWYRREGRPSLSARLLLTLLRVAAAGALVAVLLEPTLRTERVERQRSTVVVLVDRSDSMSLRDRWWDPAGRRALALWAGVADPSRFPRSAWAYQAVAGRPQEKAGGAAWLRRLNRTHEVRLYAFAGDRRPTTTAALRGKASVPGDTSRLGDAIVATLEEFSGQPLAGIVLLSDGCSNMGEDPVVAARRAGEQRVPVFTVGIGDPSSPRDLAIASLLVDDVVRKGDEAPVVVGLQHSGYTGRPVQVALRQDGRVLESRTVTLIGQGRQEVSFTYRPTQVGSHALQVSVSPLPGEESVQNNRRDARVRVVEKRLKLLFVEGSPRWEYRYLKNALLRDPTLRLACLLMDSEPSGGGEGNVQIPGFPADRRQLFDYDIVILGDVPRESLPDAQLALLRAFVEERGGSLVLIAGEAHMPWEYRGSPLEALLPATLPAGASGAQGASGHPFEQPFSLRLTPAGMRHPMLQLEADPSLNARRWESLPGGFWCGAIGRPKPGASVLVETSAGREANAGDGGRAGGASGAFPLLMIQPVGEGTTLLSLMDSTWRWRYRLGDTYFYRFWGQVLRTMTPHELPGENRLLKLTVDRERYLPGARVVLRARALTPTFHPLRAAALTAVLTRDDGTRTEVRLGPLSDRPGVYVAEWTPPRPGQYRVALRAPAGGTAAEAAFGVEEASLEQRNPEMNRELLEQVARASGGAYLSLPELDRLPGRIPDRGEQRTVRTERPFWDAPLPLGIFSLFLVGEWLLRKKAGLL
jgi:hypothetical protein